MVNCKEMHDFIYANKKKKWTEMAILIKKIFNAS